MNRPPSADWRRATPPTVDDFAAIAQAALAALPAPFAKLAGEVEFRVQDFADDEVLDALGIDDPFELTGLYQGVDLTARSVLDPNPTASMVFL